MNRELVRGTLLSYLCLAFVFGLMLFFSGSFEAENVGTGAYTPFAFAQEQGVVGQTEGEMEGQPTGVGEAVTPAGGTEAGVVTGAEGTGEGDKVEEEKAGEEGKEKEGIFAKLIHAYKLGDWPMHFILLMFIVILALSIERAIVIYFVYGKDPAKLFREIRSAFEEGGISRAMEVAEQFSNLPMGAIMLSALRVVKETNNRSEIDEKELKELVNAAVEEEYLRFIPKIQRRVPLIHIFANTAVLLGLLGAVIGLIEAFSGVAALDPAQRQIYLSRSIAIVMHSTAFGLIVAIMGVILFAVVSSRANNLVALIEEYAVRAANWVSLMSAANPKKTESSKG